MSTATKSTPSIIPEKCYPDEEAAYWLAVSPRQVRRMIEEKRIGFVRTGPQRGKRVSGQNILDYIEQNTVSTEG